MNRFAKLGSLGRMRWDKALFQTIIEISVAVAK